MNNRLLATIGIIPTAIIGLMAIFTVFKLTIRSPIAPTAPTPQQASETNQEDHNFSFIVAIPGLTAKPSKINAKVTSVLKNNLQEQFTTHITLTHVSNDQYQGYLSLYEEFLNTQVLLKIKPEKHRSALFETTLIPNMQVDLTDKPLEPGDIAITNQGQDGVIDQNDYQYIKSKIFSTDYQADLNYDGVVNAGDLSIIIDTLSSKMDEN